MRRAGTSMEWAHGASECRDKAFAFCLDRSQRRCETVECWTARLPDFKATWKDFVGVAMQGWGLCWTSMGFAGCVGAGQSLAMIGSGIQEIVVLPNPASLHGRGTTVAYQQFERIVQKLLTWVFDAPVLLLSWIRLTCPIPCALGLLLWGFRRMLRWYLLKRRAAKRAQWEQEVLAYHRTLGHGLLGNGPALHYDNLNLERVQRRY